MTVHISHLQRLLTKNWQNVEKREIKIIIQVYLRRKGAEDMQEFIMTHDFDQQIGFIFLLITRACVD